MHESDAICAITDFLDAMCVEKDQHLRETPRRFVSAFKEYLSGYNQSFETLGIVTQFDNGGYDEIILEKSIPFYSICAHHMVPFFGTAAIGYIPSGKIIGLSKLPRILDMFAKRLQVQEQLTMQVAHCIQGHLCPAGVGVIIEAEHLCMACRGIKKPGVKTITSYMLGVFRDDPASRAEFMSLIRG